MTDLNEIAEMVRAKEAKIEGGRVLPCPIEFGVNVSVPCFIPLTETKEEP